MQHLGKKTRLWHKQKHVPLFAIPAVVAVALVLLLVQVRADLGAETYCSAETNLVGHAVLLVDLRKPLDPDWQSLPSDVLREVTDLAMANTAVSVYSISAWAEAPRTLLGRLCKPYNSDELVIDTAKDIRHEARNCDDLPAQLSPPLRERARHFCDRRTEISGRLDDLAQRASSGPAQNAYLVEAFDETAREAGETPFPTVVHIVSDMLQHADWYSHLELPADQWTKALLANRNGGSLNGPPPSFPHERVDLRVHYLTRAGITDGAAAREAHRRAWHAFFSPAVPEFEDRATMAGYRAERLMDLPAPAEVAAYQLEQVRHERERIEVARQEIEAARREMDQERASLEEERRRLEDGLALLANERKRLDAEARESCGAESSEG